MYMCLLNPDSAMSCSVSTLQCSQSCGGGVQVRKVYCKQLLSTGAYRRLGNEACGGGKPATDRACRTTDCLPYIVGGEWGKVSAYLWRNESDGAGGSRLE